MSIEYSRTRVGCLCARALTGICQLLILGLMPMAALTPVSAGQAVPTPIIDEPILVDVQFDGLTSYSKESVMRALGLVIGERMQPLDVRSAFEAFGLFIKLGVFENVEGGVRLTLPVVELPSDIEPRFIGNDSYSLDKIVEWAGIGDRDFIYVHEADLVVARLNHAYRAQGFHFVEVRWVPGPSAPGEPVDDVIFQILEGPKVRCIGLELSGNDTLPDSGFWIWKGGLRRVAEVKTTGRGLISWFGRPFVEEELQADMQAMRQAYRDRGFLDVRVQLDHFEFNDLRDRVKVFVIVDEGPLWRVGSITLESLGRPLASSLDEQASLQPVPTPLAFPEEELRELLHLRVGEAFETGRSNHDVRALTEHYGAAGYLAAYLFENPRTSGGFELLASKERLDVEKHEVHVTYRIVQGRKLRLRELSLEGNENTRDRILRREVLVLPGDVVDQEKLLHAQRRLTNTGYFSDVQDPTHPMPSFLLRNVEGNPDLVDVHFTVEQGLVVNATLSGGATSDGGLLGIAMVTMENFDVSSTPSGFSSAFGEIFDKRAFHGAGQRFQMRISPGSEIDSWSASFFEPDALGTHIDPTGGGFNASGRDRRWRSHDESRNRFHVFISHLFAAADTSVQIGPVTQTVKTRNLEPPVDRLPYTLVESEGELSYLGLQFDLRVNKLDNRQYPREGSSTRWSSTLYGGFMGEDVDMLKTELNHDYYWLLGDSDQDVRSGMFAGLHMGVADSYGDTAFVPYSERFFLGGSSRLRGFRFRRVGPNGGSDYSLGGETVISGSLEYRRTLFSTPMPGTTRRQEVFRGGPFLDFGVLGLDPWDMDLDDTRVSVGISLGLTSPIPLVFNFGWPLRDGEGDDLQVFSFRVSLR